MKRTDYCDKILLIKKARGPYTGLYDLPGGSQEKNETFEETLIREIKEETGLTLKSIEFVSYFEWNVPTESTRHLVLLFRSKDFEGEIISSKEGEVFFMREDELEKYPLSTDFDKLLGILKNGGF